MRFDGIKNIKTKKVYKIKTQHPSTQSNMARSDLQAVSCTIFAYLHLVHVREGDHALHMLTIICIFPPPFFLFQTCTDAHFFHFFQSPQNVIEKYLTNFILVYHTVNLGMLSIKNVKSILEIHNNSSKISI